MTTKIDFERSMERLATIAELLENDSLPLEEAVKLFEEGLELSKQCQNQLEYYEKTVKELVAKHQSDNND